MSQTWLSKFTHVVCWGVRIFQRKLRAIAHTLGCCQGRLTAEASLELRNQWWVTECRVSQAGGHSSLPMRQWTGIITREGVLFWAGLSNSANSVLLSLTVLEHRLPCKFFSSDPKVRTTPQANERARISLPLAWSCPMAGGGWGGLKRKPFKTRSPVHHRTWKQG